MINLTDEDWNSSEAKNTALIISLIFVALATLSLAFVVALATTLVLSIAFVLSPAFVVAFIAFVALLLALILACVPFAVDAKVMLFIGAVWHHYKLKKLEELK
jgi:hypothetical protein